MIDFVIFSRLYREATSYSDVDMYIGERGYQADWMDTAAEKGIDISELLSTIWELAHMDSARLRERACLSKAAYAERYGIPYRTVQNWEAAGAEHREIPEYLKMLIAYTLLG